MHKTQRGVRNSSKQTVLYQDDYLAMSSLVKTMYLNKTVL